MKTIPYISLLAILGVSNLAFALTGENSAITSKTEEELSLWASTGYSTTSSNGRSYDGGNFIAGIQFPSPPGDRRSIRLSLSRTLDASPVDRTDLAVHGGYRIWENFEAGLLGGVEYLTTDSPHGTYLKPVLGIEARALLKQFKTNSISALAMYKTAQGSTGSLALNGGSDSLAANLFSVGLVFTLGFD